MDLYSQAYSNGNVSEKLKICFKSDSTNESLYTNWEISQIVNSISSTYYKNELLNTLKSLLEDGVNPRDIYILNSSVKVKKKSYDELRDGYLDFNDQKNITQLYHLGSPISLIPDKETLKIYSIFEFYREFYTESGKKGLKPPLRNSTIPFLYEEIDKISNSGDLKKYLESELYESNPPSLSIPEDDELQMRISETFKALEDRFKEFDKMLEKADLLEKFYQDYPTDFEKGFENTRYFGLKTIINLFMNTFQRHERPIICVRERENNHLRFICTDMIVKRFFKDGNKRFLETKSISQNSPLLIVLACAITFSPMAILAAEKIYDSSKEKLQRRVSISEKEDLINYVENKTELQTVVLNELENEVNRLKADHEKLENLKKITNDIAESSQNIIELTSIISKKQAASIISNLEEKNFASFVSTLEENSIKIEELGVSELEEREAE